MLSKKRLFPLFVICLILLLSACSSSSENISSKKLFREKERVINLLSSDKDQDVENAIERVEKYSLHSDPEVSAKLINLLDKNKEEQEFVNLVFQSLEKIPDGNFPELNNALIQQFGLAFEHGQVELEDKLLAAILKRDHTSDYEKFEFYYHTAFDQTEIEDLNRYFQLAIKFADFDTLELVLEALSTYPWRFDFQISNKSAQIVDIEFLDRLSKQESLSMIDCETMQSLLDTGTSLEYMLNSEDAVLNDYEIRNIGQIFIDKVWIDGDLNEKCEDIDPSDIIHYFRYALSVSDPEITHEFLTIHLAQFDGIQLIDEFGTGNDFSDTYKMKYQSVKLLIDSAGEEKDDFLYDYFKNNYENNGYLINRLLLLELFSKGYGDLGPQIFEVIKANHNMAWSDWSDIQWVNNYDLHLYKYDFDTFETSWSNNIGLFMDNLYLMNPDLAIESASFLMNDQVIYEEALRTPDTEKYWSMRDLTLSLGDFKRDVIVRYIVKLVTENNITMDEQTITNLRSLNNSEIANYRLMQIFRELGLEKEETVNFYASLLDSDNAYTVFNVARMLQNEFETDPQIFTPYYQENNIEVIAGAYKNADEFVKNETIKTAINTYGDAEMASYFLNDHGEWLRKVSEEWAEANGFEVYELTKLLF